MTPAPDDPRDVTEADVTGTPREITERSPSMYLPGFAAAVNRHGLRPRALGFVDKYLVLRNASKAYEAAGYRGGRHNAARMLRNPRIQAEISDRLAELRQLAVMDAQEAKERLTQIARSSIRPFLHPNDPLLACDPVTGERLITDAELALIKSITPGRYGRKIELHDPVRCTELMAKISGALKDAVKVEHALEDIVAGVMPHTSGESR